MPDTLLSSLTLLIHPTLYCVAKLESDSSVTALGRYEGDFWSVTQTSDEISIVVQQTETNLKNLKNAETETDWSMIQIREQLAFDMVGIIAGLAKLLANAKVSIFCLSTFNTDYIFVKQSQLDLALTTLSKHRIHWTKYHA